MRLSFFLSSLLPFLFSLPFFLSFSSERPRDSSERMQEGMRIWRDPNIRDTSLTCPKTRLKTHLQWSLIALPIDLTLCRPLSAFEKTLGIPKLALRSRSFPSFQMLASSETKFKLASDNVVHRPTHTGKLSENVRRSERSPRSSTSNYGQRTYYLIRVVLLPERARESWSLKLCGALFHVPSMSTYVRGE